MLHKIKQNHSRLITTLPCPCVPLPTPSRYLAATGHSLATSFGDYNENKTIKLFPGKDEK